MARRWLERLKDLITRDREDADLARELQSHLDAEIDDQLDRGVAADEAPYAARRAFGNVTLAGENTRAAWGWRAFSPRAFASGLWQDVRYGIRSLAKQPTFTAGAVLALALGIGATTTIFSVIRNVLLDPYPMYTNVDRMVGIRIQDLSGVRGGGRDYLPGPEILDYQAQAASFETIIAGTGEDTLYTTADGTEQFNGGLTTGNTFLVLGVPAFLGRTLTPDDEKPDAPAVFV